MKNTPAALGWLSSNAQDWLCFAARSHKYRKEDKPNSGGVLWNVFKRTINITEYRNAKDDGMQRRIERLVALLIIYCQLRSQ
jgi:hypothetical protein